MKKITFIVMLLSLCLTGFAQNRVEIPKSLKNQTRAADLSKQNDRGLGAENESFVPLNEFKEALMMGDETEIIETKYDLQTNAALTNRIYCWPDGAISAVCTRGIESPSATGGFPDRGTGYNYFDGTAWFPKPTARLESVRTGWPSITAWGNEGEFIAAHTAILLKFSRRPVKGTGAWEELVNYNGPSGTEPAWPRIVTTGENKEYLQLFYNSYNAYQGLGNALLYSRSMDGGNTWSPQDQILDDLSSANYKGFGGDDYALSSRGNTVALLCVNFLYDLFILKSDDNGENWTKIVIWEHPIPLFDYTTMAFADTLYGPGKSAGITIDNEGKCHVVYNVCRFLLDTPSSNGAYSTFPYIDGIGYWNENMEAPIPEPDEVPSWVQYPEYWTLNPDYLYENGMLIGWSQDVNGNGTLDFVEVGAGEFPFANYREAGLSVFPTITITENGILAVVFSSVTEGFSTSDGRYNYRHTWVRTSPDMGYTWGDFFDLQADNIFHFYDECIFGEISPYTSSEDENFHLVYFADNLPGLFLDNDEQTEPTINRLIYSKVSKDEIVGVKEPGTTEANLSVHGCVPNPASGKTDIMVSLKQPGNVTISLFNITGQKVSADLTRYVPFGTYPVSLDVSGLPGGIYFYQVNTGNESFTGKLIVE